jgi:hypothetical protein
MQRERHTGFKTLAMKSWAASLKSIGQARRWETEAGLHVMVLSKNSFFFRKPQSLFLRPHLG